MASSFCKPDAAGQTNYEDEHHNHEHAHLQRKQAVQWRKARKYRFE
jgi:hypothetical protein